MISSRLAAPLMATLLAMSACRMKSQAPTELASAEGSATSGSPIDDSIGSRLIAKTNPSAKTVEVTLTVQEADVDLGNGQTMKALTYNGGVPGPTIEANVGDDLILHVKNASSEGTILHPHGFVLPHMYDGTHLSQKPIPPGGSFTHRFRLLHAGTYWYHSHFHASRQMGRGLYGAIIVHGPNEPIMREKVLVISNVSTEATPPDDNNLLEPHMYVINGKTSRDGSMRPGESQRYRVINAASQTIVDLHLSNGQPMTLIATDGGLTERPYQLNRIQLQSGERADLVITAPSSGDGFDLIGDPIHFLPRNAPPNTTNALSYISPLLPDITDPKEPTKLLHIKLEGPRATPITLPAQLAVIPKPTNFAATREFTVGMTATIDPSLQPMPATFTFPINDHTYPDTPTPVEKLGTWVKHRWINTSPSMHPIHTHGFRFVVLSRNGLPEPIRGWKDTTDLPAFGSLEYALYLDGYPGQWLYHCHFESHMESGTMGMMIVEDPKKPGSTGSGTPGAASGK